jgi:glycogen debranching enzyme
VLTVDGQRLKRIVGRRPAVRVTFLPGARYEHHPCRRQAIGDRHRWVFNEDFRVADEEYFALALDAEGGQVDALSSNISHLSWSGIVDNAKPDAVVRHVLGPRLYSGREVRTLAEGEGRYDPIGYHTDTVWPFDCSFIAWGLRRYGYRDEAAGIAAGILDAATVFDGRPPEAFVGYERQRTRYRCGIRPRAVRRPGRRALPCC